MTVLWTLRVVQLIAARFCQLGTAKMDLRQVLIPVYQFLAMELWSDLNNAMMQTIILLMDAQMGLSIRVTSVNIYLQFVFLVVMEF